MTTLLVNVILACVAGMAITALIVCAWLLTSQAVRVARRVARRVAAWLRWRDTIPAGRVPAWHPDATYQLPDNARYREPLARLAAELPQRRRWIGGHR